MSPADVRALQDCKAVWGPQYAVFLFLLLLGCSLVPRMPHSFHIGSSGTPTRFLYTFGFMALQETWSSTHGIVKRRSSARRPSICVILSASFLMVAGV